MITPAQLAQSEVNNTCVSKISREKPHQLSLLCDVSHLLPNASNDGTAGTV
jgi:hypothetical protein